MSDRELGSALRDLQLLGFVTLAMAALTIYEYVITADQEVLYVWKRRRSGASLLLFSMRCIMVLAALQDIIAFTVVSKPKACGVLSITDVITKLIGFILIDVFASLRVYALCGRSAIGPWIIVFLLHLPLFAVNVYCFVKSLSFVDPSLGCFKTYKFTFETERSLVYVALVPAILGDALVVGITWMKSCEQLRVQRSAGIRMSLSTVLFRDGVMYFILLLILSALEMSPLTSTLGGVVVAGLNNSLPLLLVNRFMLNLRQLSDADTHSAGRMQTISTLAFRIHVDVAGNMGEPLEHGWEPEFEARDVDSDEVEEIPRRDEEAGPLGYQSD